jgi:methyltransferase (TIGR00027 family)
VQFIVRLTRWQFLRNVLIKLTEKTAQGIWGSVLCRKRYVEDKLQEAVDAIDAVVILGSGLDTLAYRMTELGTLPVFEVDLPENIAFKRTKLEELYGQLPTRVRLVPIDFERQDLETVLAEYGFQTSQRTFFVWEAVSQYLTEDGVRKIFDFLAKAARGSRLVFTYIRQDFLDGVNLYGAAMTYERFRVKQQLWHFGLIPERVAAFLAAYGWEEGEQMGSQEFVTRYIRPSGRDIPVTELERSVYAEKT